MPAMLRCPVPALSSLSFNKAKTVLEQAIANQELPSAVAAVGTSQDIDIIFAQGVRRYTKDNDEDFMFIEDVSVNQNTLYDLGTLTHVIGTLPGILELVENNYINLHDRVGRFFSNAGYWQANPLADVSIAELLTHTSGLPAWKAIYAITPHRKTAIANLLQTELAYQTGTWVFSDLNYMVLGAILERVTRIRLDEFIGHYVFEPLNLANTSYGPIVDTPVAATEYCGWRGEMLEGQVHDENAYVLDNIAGHAGVFSNIIDVASYAQTWLNLDEKLANQELLKTCITTQVTSEDVRYGYGWELASESVSTGQANPAEAYGLSSFTGTSIWINPIEGWFCTLLTNAIHPHRANASRFHEIRIDFHNYVAEAFNKTQ